MRQYDHKLTTTVWAFLGGPLQETAPYLKESHIWVQRSCLSQSESYSISRQGTEILCLDLSLIETCIFQGCFEDQSKYMQSLPPHPLLSRGSVNGGDDGAIVVGSAVAGRQASWKLFHMVVGPKRYSWAAWPPLTSWRKRYIFLYTHSSATN